MTAPDRPFDALDTDAQVELLREVALRAAGDYGLTVASLNLLLHGFNTTFVLVTPDGRRVAVRVGTNSLAGPEHLRAQQAWAHALATETDVRVPDVVPTSSGEPFTTVPEPSTGREFRVVVNTWLDGPDVEEPDPQQAHALGRVMATMHAHARGWSLPAGAALPLFDEPLLGEAPRLHEIATGADAEVLAEAMARTQDAFTADLAAHRPVVIHGDLHGGNLKWHEGRIAVFDLDDCGLGTPALDLAVATFYLRDAEGAPAEAALRAGYVQVEPWPDVPEEVFEALVASRQLLLLDTMVTTSTPQFREMLPEYLERSVHRLRHWLDTGSFRLDPPG